MIESYPFTNGFTVECMVKMRTRDLQVVVGKDGQPGLETIGLWDPAFQILFRDDNYKIQFGFWSTPSNLVSCLSSFEYNTGKWYCIAAVCNGSQAYFYIKEEADTYYELESTALVPGGKGMIITENTWTVGRGMWHGNPANACIGVIDEVRISNIALKPNEFLGSGIPEPGIITGIVALVFFAFKQRYAYQKTYFKA